MAAMQIAQQLKAKESEILAKERALKDAEEKLRADAQQAAAYLAQQNVLLVLSLFFNSLRFSLKIVTLDFFIGLKGNRRSCPALFLFFESGFRIPQFDYEIVPNSFSFFNSALLFPLFPFLSLFLLSFFISFDYLFYSSLIQFFYLFTPSFSNPKRKRINYSSSSKPKRPTRPK